MRVNSWLALLGSAVVLAACASQPVRVERTPPFYQRLDVAGRGLDPASSIAMINEYRRGKGLPTLAIDPSLARLAQEQATWMGSRDQVRTSLDKARALPTRLKAAGVAVAAADENVSAGYRTFAEAFSGWRESKPHNAVMLHPRATRVGIATSYQPTSKYQVFWSLIVAE
jgi:uncharacterized protein YkwD